MSVRFKELCLLHLRDEAEQPFRPLKDLFDDPAHVVTWSTLQRLLHADLPDIRAFTALHQQGRLSAEKLEFSRQALEFLLKRREERASAWHGVYENIYEVVWLYGFDQDYNVQTSGFYRGQHDSRWRQVSTLLRDKHDGTPLDVATLVGRVLETERIPTEGSAGSAQFLLLLAGAGGSIRGPGPKRHGLLPSS